MKVSSNSFDNILITGNSSATIANSSIGGTPVNEIDVESTSSAISPVILRVAGPIAFGINIGTGSSVTLTGGHVLVIGNALGIQIGVEARRLHRPRSSFRIARRHRHQQGRDNRV